STSCAGMSNAPLVLTALLRVLFLVALCIGHGKGGAVNSLDVTPLPVPTPLGLLLAFSTTSPGEFADDFFRQSLPRFAVGCGVCIDLLLTMGDAPAVQPVDGIAAGVILRQGLPQEHPEGDYRGVDPLAKPMVKLLADSSYF